MSQKQSESHMGTGVVELQGNWYGGGAKIVFI